eukprot:TRINITY_DN19264_c0_g1_i14.p1 TRINITY_DN19264_c0_g1~~TRINITY_DN19264_c0_g1_i14.p1  ORF type:complete len:241 (-),score=38.46 TRINITY_DN19264_c0_g1_i14:230-856(-)
MLDPYGMEIRWQQLRDAFLAVVAQGACRYRRLGKAPIETHTEAVRQHLDERWTAQRAVIARHSESWHRARMYEEERRQRGIARRAACAGASERRKLAQIDMQVRAAVKRERRHMGAEEARQRRAVRLSDRLAKREHRGMLEEDRAAQRAKRRERLERRRAERRERRYKRDAEGHLLRTERAIGRLLRQWERLEAAKVRRGKQKTRFEK